MNKFKTFFLVINFNFMFFASEPWNQPLDNLDSTQQELLLRAGFSQYDIDQWSWKRNHAVQKEISNIQLLDYPDLVQDDKAVPLCQWPEFCKLRQIAASNPLEHGKYFFSKETVSEYLQNVLMQTRLGFKVVYSTGETVVVRYNFSQKYVLYLVENDSPYFEIRS